MDSSSADAIVGASQSIIDGTWQWPVHGLRHPAAGATSGWYIWTGKLSDRDDFFKPWHVTHLVARVPEVEHLLSLPPGTRFLIAPGYEDIWEDQSLLDV